MSKIDNRILAILSMILSVIFVISIWSTSHTHSYLLISLATLIVLTIIKGFNRVVAAILTVTIIASLFGLLSYSSHFITGYTDAQVHYQSTLDVLATNSFNIQTEISFNYVLLYSLSASLYHVTGIDIQSISNSLPLLVMCVTCLLFYLASANLGMGNIQCCVSTFIFISTWGVFRFNMEYRTLNIGMLLIVLFILLLTIEYEKQNSITLTKCLAIISISLSHFVTSIYFVALLLSHAVSQSIVDKRKRPSDLHYIIFTILVIFVYAAYLTSTLEVSGRTIITQLMSLFVVNTSPSGGQGVAGLTYGYNIFLLEWLLRGIFIISFISLLIYFYHHRDANSLFIIFLSIIYGIILFITAIYPSILNPERTLTYFAIPFSWSIAIGIPYIITRGNNTIKDYKSEIATAAIIVLIVIATISVTISVVKMPSEIIGETEPLRSEKSFDNHHSMTIDSRDYSSRQFVGNFVVDGTIFIDYEMGSRALQEFYLREVPDGIYIASDLQDDSYFDGTLVLTDVDKDHKKISKIYDNGVSYKFVNNP